LHRRLGRLHFILDYFRRLPHKRLMM
jgi:hypothetical protein